MHFININALYKMIKYLDNYSDNYWLHCSLPDISWTHCYTEYHMLG